MHYKLSLEAMKIRRVVYYQITLLRSPLGKKFILECIINVVHMPPGVFQTIDFQSLAYDYTATVDSLISVFMLCRLYIVLRIFKDYSRWTSRQAYRIW